MKKEKCQEKNKKFKNRVYEITKQIPKGKILTYKIVAKLAGQPRAWRAVGNILNKNKNPQIPCHRVIRSNREIGGYRDGTKKKIYLLQREGVKIDIPYRRGVGRTLRFSRVGKQAFACSENVRNRGFLKSEPEARLSLSKPSAGTKTPERASD